MKYNKKGVTVVSVLVIVVVLIALTSVITVSMNVILRDTYKREFVREYKLVKASTSDYVVRNSGIIDFTQTELNISTIDTKHRSQFDGETIVSNKIEMYIIDLEKIGINNTTYGNANDTDDIYLFSKETGEVYYKKGFTYKGSIYYKGIDI